MLCSVHSGTEVCNLRNRITFLYQEEVFPRYWTLLIGYMQMGFPISVQLPFTQ